MMLSQTDIIVGILAIFAGFMGCTGFWSWLENRKSNKDVNTQILLGLGHDRICYLGKQYIKRGYITPEEHDNLFNYLWTPYSAGGGNGSAAEIVRRVTLLPVQEHSQTQPIAIQIVQGGNANETDTQGQSQSPSDTSC